MEKEIEEDAQDLDIESFKDMKFESESMRFLIKMEQFDDHDKLGNVESYDVQNMFPTWIINDPEWKLTESRHKENEISIIMRIPVQQRTQEQISTLVHWLMSVWETARLMGFKRCAAMSKVFQVLTYEPGENIITEGERGLTFFIIISGSCIVHKIGIGNVATLFRGQSFGELALTEGKDLRTATIRSESSVEVLRLHKVDYDYFVKDIQLAERRENLHILQTCRGFESWSKAKIRKMVTICKRKVFEPGSYIFRQGDAPDMLYIIIDGQVSISKEIHYSIRNRWPTSISEWECVTRSQVKPYVVAVLTKGTCFGEQSVILNRPRHATAQAKSLCTLLCVDRLEFVHLLEHNSTDTFAMSKIIRSYRDDGQILNEVAELRGGPSTTAQLNDYLLTTENGSEKPTSPNLKLIRTSEIVKSANLRGHKTSLFQLNANAVSENNEINSIQSASHRSTTANKTSTTTDHQPFLHEKNKADSSSHLSNKSSTGNKPYPLEKSSSKTGTTMEKFRVQLRATLEAASLSSESMNSIPTSVRDHRSNSVCNSVYSSGASSVSSIPVYKTSYGINNNAPTMKKGALLNGTAEEDKKLHKLKFNDTASDCDSYQDEDYDEFDQNNDDVSTSFSELSFRSSNSVSLPDLQNTPSKNHLHQRKQSLSFNSSPSKNFLSPIKNMSESVAVTERIGKPKRKASILAPMPQRLNPIINFS